MAAELLDLSLYDYDLPPERIAQTPAPRRDESRLLRLDRASGRLSHHRFRDLVELLRPGDVLVMNDTRVVPARLVGRKRTGGRVEVLLLDIPSGPPNGRPLECLVKGGRGLKPDQEFTFEAGLRAVVERVERYGRCWLHFEGQTSSWPELLKLIGSVPLPPYIHRASPPDWRSPEAGQYQTVYALRQGAVAAPTAGLHFTDELLAEMERRGLERVMVTLHVGYGTFEPLRQHHLTSRRLHPESFEVSAEAAERLNRALREGRRLVAVGTSTVRLLEHLALSGGIRAASGQTDLFISPGFKFKAVGAMLTNFHLPLSSLLMLVSALAGRQRILAAYGEAIKAGYRFYSFGDAMLIEDSGRGDG